MTDTTEMTAAVIEAIQDKKGKDITLIDLSEIETSSAPEFIIATGNSTSQVASIADNIREELLKKLGVKPYNYDGYRNSQWIVIDYGNVMIHIFLPDVREHYNLESLWCDGKITEIPNLD